MIFKTLSVSAAIAMFQKAEAHLLAVVKRKREEAETAFNAAIEHNQVAIAAHAEADHAEAIVSRLTALVAPPQSAPVGSDASPSKGTAAAA